MAYNPFSIFRRNQKAIFAVITVFIMFTFILSSGLGGGADFFDWLPQWLGKKSRKGEVVCTIDGSKVYESQLSDLRFNRVMANRFMSLAAGETRAGLDHYVNENLRGLGPEASRAMMGVVQGEAQMERFRQNPQLAPLIHGMLQELKDSLSQLLRMPNVRPEDKGVARVKLASLSLFQYQVQAQLLSGGEHYFASSPNRTNRDLVHFILWQKKADELGIKFTDDDVKKLIEREFYDFFRPESEVRVRRHLQQNMANFNLSKCIEAIGEEFRVRAAQTAVLGSSPHGGRGDKTFGGFPAYPTSYEGYEFYREQCSPTTYGAIPVSALNFIDRVGEPDETDRKVREELMQLFDKYKDDEPYPGRETPGFKKPREIKIEYLTITGNEPYYTKLAEEQLKAGELQAKVGSLMTVPLLGASPAWVAPASAPVAVKEPLVLAAYKARVAQFQAALGMSYRNSNLAFSESPLASQLLESSVVRPGNLVAAAGTMGGQLLSFGNPYAALTGVASGPIAYEIRDRVRAGVPAILLALGTIPGVSQEVLGLRLDKQPVPGPLPGPAMFANVIGGAAAYELMLPKPLSIETVKPQLMKDLIDSTAKALAFGEQSDPRFPRAVDPKKKGDLQTFIDEVNKLSDNGKVRPADKEKMAKLREYITKFAADRGLTVRGNKTPLTEFVLEEDPDLAPLVAAQKKSLEEATGFHGGRNYIPFASSFFWVGQDRRSSVNTLYAAEPYPPAQRGAGDEPRYVVWRSEEIPAKAAASYPAVKDAVKAAWKRIKARELAKARAEAIEKAIRGGGSTLEEVIKMNIADEAAKLSAEFADPKARDRVKPFLIEGVAPLTLTTNPTASKGLFSITPVPALATMRDFSFPPSENVKYPSFAMGRTLLDERTKPVKTVFLTTDEPKDIYFVVTLLKREVKSDRDFQALVEQDDFIARLMARQTGQPPSRDVVLGRFHQDVQRKTMESVMGLLKKQFKYEETEEQKKRLDESTRGGDL
jgi:hypothetical protein